MSNDWSEIERQIKAGSIDDAIDQLEILRANGDLKSIVALGLAYEKKGYGRRDGSWERAFERYREAVDRSDDPVAHLGLTRMYYFGLSVAPDYKMAYMHAARAEPTRQPIAAIFLGEMLLNGLGVAQDISRSVEFFGMAAKSGYAFGWIGLARCALVRGRRWSRIFNQCRAMISIVSLALLNDGDKLFGVAKKYGVIARNCWRESSRS